MVTIESIEDEIINYTVLKDIVEVEFEHCFLEVDFKYFEDIELSKSTLAEVILKYYREE